MKKHVIALFLSFICLTASAQRVTLAIHQDYSVPEIPIITQIGDTLGSSSPIGNQWYKDGVELPGEINQKLVISASGNYKVDVTLGSGCSSESNSLLAIKTDVSIIQSVDFTCSVFPNPNNGMFIIEMKSDQSMVFDLELFTSSGESVARKSLHHSPGTDQIPFGKASIADGVYYLQIRHGSHSLSRQIIVK